MSNTSPAPNAPQGPEKALVSALAAAITAFLAFYVADTDPFTKKDIGLGLLLAFAASGVTGVPTYITKNRAK